MCLNKAFTKAPWAALMVTIEQNTVVLGLSVHIFSLLLCSYQFGKIFSGFAANYFTRILSFRVFNVSTFSLQLMGSVLFCLCQVGYYDHEIIIFMYMGAQFLMG